MTIMELGKRFKQLFGFNPPIDMILTQMRRPRNAAIDLVKLDEEFAKRNPEYDNKKCTYKGKPHYSMSRFVNERYGEDAERFIGSN